MPSMTAIGSARPRSWWREGASVSSGSSGWCSDVGVTRRERADAAQRGEGKVAMQSQMLGSRKGCGREKRSREDLEELPDAA